MENELKQKSDTMAEEAMRGLRGYPTYGFAARLNRLLKTVTGQKTSAHDQINWPAGLLANALMAHYQNNTYSEISLTIKYALIKYFKRFVNNRQGIHCLGDTVAGWALIDLHRITGDERYKPLLDCLVFHLKEHAVDEEGSFIYRPGRGEMDINAAGIGMVCPFLCKYGQTYGDQGAISLAVVQLMNYAANGMDEKSGLPYHGYTHHDRLRHGIIGWGRACGWLMTGMVDSLVHMDEGHPDYNAIKQNFRRLVDKVESYQREDGMYPWMLAAAEGPHDTAATAMILYAIARGIEHGILIGIHRSRMIRGRDALLAAVDGGQIANCLTESLGFGLYPQRYGVYPWSLGPALSLFSTQIKDIIE